MWIVYDILCFFMVLLYAPYYAFRRKFHKGFLRRFGILPKHIFYERPLWVHAVSVGEAQSIKQLVKGLHGAYSGRDVVISTVTPTGNAVALSMASQKDFVTYLPLDFSFIVSRVIDQIEPAAFIIAETELWPNLLAYLYKKGIPVIIVNARLSDRSFKRYSLIDFLVRPLLSRVSLICAQTERDKKRFCSLGAREEAVQVTGNMKFDIQGCVIPQEQKMAACTLLDMGRGAQLFVAGSTHPGEELMLMRAYRRLLREFPLLKLLIAPRHPERALEIKRCASAMKFSCVRLSELNGPGAAAQIYLLDTIGELMKFYSCADVVFVGGSLVKKGGHNILEPASLSLPVVVGPHLFNFRDITDLFIRHEALIMVRDEAQLCEAVSRLLGNAALRTALGAQACTLIAEQKGATERNIRLIGEHVSRV